MGHAQQQAGGQQQQQAQGGATRMQQHIPAGVAQLNAAGQLVYVSHPTLGDVGQMV